MPRGNETTSRATAYRGAVGTTRRTAAHWLLDDGTVLAVSIYAGVDAAADPELAQRLLADRAPRALNTVELPDGGTAVVTAPVVYHDPINRLFVLVLGESDRHRAVREHAALLAQIADDTSAPVPAYVREPAVVFGAAGLKRYLEAQAERALAAARGEKTAPDSERAAAERAAAGEIERRKVELDRRSADLERRSAELDRRSAELERIVSDTDRRGAEARTAEMERRVEAPAPTLAPRTTDEVKTDPFALVEHDDADSLHPTAERPRAPSLVRPATVSGLAASNGAGSPASSVVSAGPAPSSAPSPSAPAARTATAAPAARTATAAPAARTATASPTSGEPASAPSPEAATAAATAAAAAAVVTQLFDAELLATESRLAAADDAGLPPGATESYDADRTDVGGTIDFAIERWIASREPQVKLIDEGGTVRLALSLPPEDLEILLGKNLDLRLQLHRLPTYALVTLSLGGAAAVRGQPGTRPPVAVQFDVAATADRAVLALLTRDFRFVCDLYDRDYLPVRRRHVSAQLSENTAYLLHAADEHLRGLASGERSFARAVIAWSHPDYDRWGWRHPERAELREDKLAQLETAQAVRRALSMARRFSRPSHEDYLVAVRSYPLPLWRQRRTEILDRAIGLGIWMGPELAQVAVSEGLARSRKELVKRLDEAFTRLLAEPGRNDLDADAIADNRAALTKQLAENGEAPRRNPRGTQPIASEDDPVVSGTIALATQRSHEHGRTVDELLSLLDDKQQRVSAAVELCHRGDERAIRPVFNAVRRLGRAEAVRVLGAAVRFGPSVVPALIASLGSHRAYVRHGSALALASLGGDVAVEAIVDLLLGEPTEIWRELARAVGHAGAPAIMPLASRLSRAAAGEQEAAIERIAWALAHIATRGQRPAIEILAAGQNPRVSAVARQALELLPSAARDDLHVRGETAPNDQTVNRAFSRRFFEALERGDSVLAGPDGVVAATDGTDVSAPTLLLDEDDLMAMEESADALDDDDGAELDESDLLPT